MHCYRCIPNYTATQLLSHSTLWGCAAAAASNPTTLTGYTAGNTTTSTPQHSKDLLLRTADVTAAAVAAANRHV